MAWRTRCERRSRDSWTTFFRTSAADRVEISVATEIQISVSYNAPSFTLISATAEETRYEWSILTLCVLATGASERPTRVPSHISSAPNYDMSHRSTSPTRLSTSPTARSRNESPTPNGRGVSPTAVARPPLSFSDLKLQRTDHAIAPKTLFKAEWKSFGLFGCLADHTMNECINLMRVC
jgi:hypothetical protein